MFISSSEYEKALRTVVEESSEISVAVAFWGQGAELLLRAEPPRKMNLICNLRSGATNPETIAILCETDGVNVRQHDRLHAKVILSQSSMLIGSANLSSNGINLEGEEINGWEEAGILSQDAAQISAAKK